MKTIESNQFFAEQLSLLKRRLNKDDDSVEWQDITDLREQYYGKPQSRETARKGGVIIDEYLEAGWTISPPSGCEEGTTGKQSVTINSDSSQTSDRQFYIEDETKLRDPEYLLQLHNYDPKFFELISAKNSKWNFKPTGEDVRTFYSSRVTVRSKSPGVTQDDISQWFDKLDRKYRKPELKYDRALNSEGDKVLILPISDLHYNLLSSVLESGVEYNCDIAQELYFKIICDVIARTKQYKFEKIIFTIGGDFANGDNLSGTTTKGTPQCNQHGYFEMMEHLYAITIMAIDILLETAPVEVILINGNHDTQSGVALANYCKAWYRDCPDVRVDTSPLPRKYFVFGKTLFCLAHDADMKRLPMLIADECRSYWSGVDTTEVFLQHLHSEAVLMEQNNMRIQRLPTVSEKSSWSIKKGYNSKRQCKSFVFDKEWGLTDVLYTPIK